MQVTIWYIPHNIQYLFEARNCNVHLRYCVLLKIKIFYVYIKLFRTIILTSTPIIASTFKRALTSKCLCWVRCCCLINILKKQQKAEQALDSTHKPSLVCNQLWAKVLGRYVWHGLTSELFCFLDDENSDSSRNVHVLVGPQPPYFVWKI